jgi:Holliday junction resolvase RusA-like endonuclease
MPGGKSPKTKTTRSRRIYINQTRWDARTIPGGVVFIIPENMPSLNLWKNWHWAAQDRFKKRLTENFYLLALHLGCPRYDRARVEVVHYHRTGNRRDADNYTPKAILDALRGAKVLVDDNAEVLVLPEPVFRVDKENWRTEVYVYDLGVQQ